jgi:hypothetical protein
LLRQPRRARPGRVGAHVHRPDRHGVTMNALVVTALVYMYCKCGQKNKNIY